AQLWAVGASWEIITASHQVVINTNTQWPQYVTRNGVKYQLWNPVENYQDVFVGLAIPHTRTDFISGAGQFTWTGADTNNPCRGISTGENSEMYYYSPSCNSAQ